MLRQLTEIRRKTDLLPIAVVNEVMDLLVHCSSIYIIVALENAHIYSTQLVLHFKI